MGDIMKKRRGKQPIKPDIEEALKERLVYLKGVQGSTMNIPIIYRRTFNWESDSIIFKPINKRAFVVYRSDLEDEDIDPDNFVIRKLDIGKLPWYPSGRVEADDRDRSRKEELKEMLVSLSLTDRFVHVDVSKPDDMDLQVCLRDDLESLSGELGYSYSTIPDAYRCTFQFPRHTNEQMVNRSVSVLRSTMKLLRGFIEDFLDLSCNGAKERLEEIRYSVEMAEVNMDRIYTNALNVHWDLPQIEPAGFFLISQSCERSHDEIEYLVDCSLEVLDLLDCSDDNDVMGLLFDELISIWRSSIGKALDKLDAALQTREMGEDEALVRCLTIIREHRMEKQRRSSMQDRSITELATKIEGLSTRNVEKGGIKLFARKEYVGSIELLFGMNQSAVRLGNISKVIATKQLYVINSKL